jgi:hypothetical protein
MGLLPVALLLGVCVQAQDGKPNDPKPAAAELAAALKKTAAKGPFAFTGRLTTEVNPDDADEEATTCAVSGSAAPGGATVVQVQGDSSVHELLRKGNKVAGRETWKGHPLDLINGPSELLSFLDLDRLAVYVKDASSVKALPDEKSGAEDVAVYELAVPKGTVRSFHDESEAAEEEEKSLRSVTLRLRVRKSDGLVEKIEAAVRRVYKDDDKPGDGTKGLSTYSLRLKDFGTAEVVIPPGLEKLLKD